MDKFEKCVCEISEGLRTCDAFTARNAVEKVLREFARNLDECGALSAENFTVTFTPVMIDGAQYAIADKTSEEIHEAYFSGKQINASVVANGISMPLILQFNMALVTFYSFMITSSGTGGIKEIGINVIGEPAVAPYDSGYDETWKVGRFTIQATE